MKIKCLECGAMVHMIEKHLAQSHPNMTLADYKKKHPGAAIFSDEAKAMLKTVEEQRAAAATPAAAAPAPAASQPTANSYTGAAAYSLAKKPLHEVFGLGKVKAAMSVATGNPIPITVLSSTGSPEMVPAKDEGYVFDIDELKSVVLALELRLNLYIYGHKGSGKTELAEQTAACTGRPMIRVQHTINTEESHIVGQWAVKNGETVFHLGPLPEAMMNGWMYVADEYDFALPSVTSVYQAVMEGKALFIKEAPPELRLIKPHPNFRFVATGNTNGSGDETGLYQGTNVQNSANYDRFGMMIHKQYMPADAETRIIANRTGIKDEEARKVVQFATHVRQAYHDGKISDTVSPRTLINATRIGIARASFRQGLTLAFINKLTAVDRKVVDDIAQRIFSAS